MNNPVIGIKLSDGSFYPVLKSQGTEKKRLILAAAKRDQNKAVIEIFRGEGESMEVPEKIGVLVLENVGGADHDIELIMGRQADGEVTASAKVVGSSHYEMIQLSGDQQPYTEDDTSDDFRILQSDEISQDSLDDFSLDGLDAPDFDANDDSGTSEKDDLSLVEDPGSDEGFDNFDFGDLGDESSESETEQTDSSAADDVGDFELGSLDGEGADQTSGSIDLENQTLSGDDDLGEFDLGDVRDLEADSPVESSDAGSEEDFDSLSNNSPLEDISLDSGLAEEGKEQKKSSEAVPDFSLDEISLDDGHGSFEDQNLANEEAVGQSYDDFSFEDSGTGGSLGDDNNFDLDNDFTLDDASLKDSQSDDFSTQNQEALSEDLSWSPPPADAASPEENIEEQGEAYHEPTETRSKSAKKVKKPKETPVVVKEGKQGVEKPDRLSLILGLVVFIPLALLLIVLVVLNMVRPAVTPPLTLSTTSKSLAIGTQNREQPKITEAGSVVIPFV